MGYPGDVGRGEGRLPLVFCCSAREETRKLSLGKEKVWRSSVGGLSGSLAGLT